MTIKLLTTDQLSELIGVRSDTLRHWRRLGNGPTFLKIGGHVRYKADVVEAWIDSRARTSTSQKAPAQAAVA